MYEGIDIYQKENKNLVQWVAGTFLNWQNERSESYRDANGMECSVELPPSSRRLRPSRPLVAVLVASVKLIVENPKC